MSSSSIGALGCKLNTHRFAYWPAVPGCDDQHVLHIDTSGGAYDISYGAWNYLGFGLSATERLRHLDGLPSFRDGSMCRYSLSLPAPRAASSANSLNYVAACAGRVAKNYVLYNILNPVCTWGCNTECTVDLAAGKNQPTCPNILGLTVPLTTAPVYNTQHDTGQFVLAQ